MHRSTAEKAETRSRGQPGGRASTRLPPGGNRPGRDHHHPGRSLFDEIHVKAHAHTPAFWKAQLKTHGQSDVYVVDNKFAPGGTSGWHSHPGPSLILVVAGTVTNYAGDDPSCTPHTYTAGEGFIDPGGGDVHLLRNETGAPAETIAVQLLPTGADRRVDFDPAPGNCPF